MRLSCRSLLWIKRMELSAFQMSAHCGFCLFVSPEIGIWMWGIFIIKEIIYDNTKMSWIKTHFPVSKYITNSKLRTYFWVISNYLLFWESIQAYIIKIALCSKEKTESTKRTYYFSFTNWEWRFEKVQLS